MGAFSAAANLQKSSSRNHGNPPRLFGLDAIKFSEIDEHLLNCAYSDQPVSNMTNMRYPVSIILAPSNDRNKTTLTILRSLIETLKTIGQRDIYLTLIVTGNDQAIIPFSDLIRRLDHEKLIKTLDGAVSIGQTAPYFAMSMATAINLQHTEYSTHCMARELMPVYFFLGDFSSSENPDVYKELIRIFVKFQTQKEALSIAICPQKCAASSLSAFVFDINKSIDSLLTQFSHGSSITDPIKTSASGTPMTQTEQIRSFNEYLYQCVKKAQVNNPF